MTALLSFLPLFALQKSGFLRALGLSFLTLAAGIALLGLSGWFLTAAALTTAGIAFNIFAPSAGLRGLAFVRILSRYGERIAGHDATLRFLSDLRSRLFARLFDAVPLAGAGLSRPDLVSRFVADVDALDNAFLTAIGPITTALLVGLAMTAGLGRVLPGAALAYGLCFLAATLGVPALLALASRRAGAELVAASADLRQIVLDGLDAHQDLVALGAVDQSRAAAQIMAERLRSANRKLALLGAVATATTQVLSGMALLMALLAGIPAVQAGQLDAPWLVGIVLAAIGSFEAVAPLVRGAARFNATTAAAERVQQLATLETAIADPAEPQSAPGNGAIAFDNVSFGYAGRRPILDDLTLAVPAGHHVAITGPSGVGKSTIASLLVRLADPQQGAIRLDGVDIRAMAVAELRRQIALMPQDAPVFWDTIRANLMIGDPDAPESAMWQRLAEVGLADFVRGLPAGLDTIIGEAGSTLSVGQARRLVLARTLLSPAKVLILDEPTSGVDPETEAAFFRNLAQTCHNRTLILITHASLPKGVVTRTFRFARGRLTIDA